MQTPEQNELMPKAVDPQIHIHLLVVSWLLLVYSLGASVNSSTGTLHFDVNGDGAMEATLNSTGLGIGTTPSSNLHVAGNAIVTNRLMIGSSTGSSNLEIGGTVGYSIETVSSNVSISGNSVVLADTTSGDLTLRTPSTTGIDGRIYQIKKLSSSANLYLYHPDASFDGMAYLKLAKSSGGSLPHAKIICSSGNWYVLSINGNSSIVSSDNLISWWKLDVDHNDNRAWDSSGQGNHPYLQGTNFFHSTYSTAGISGNALSFDGSTHKIYLNFDSHMDFERTDAFSIFCWIKTSNADSYIISKMINSSQTGYYMATFNSTGKLTVSLANTSNTNELREVTTTADELDDNQWHHVGFTYDGSSSSAGLKLYIDGQEKTTDITYDTLSSTILNDDKAYLGIRDGLGTDRFAGQMDDIRIYNKVLSASEIQELYQVFQ
jgi:hypothetical protein